MTSPKTGEPAVSAPARVAAPDEAVSLDELQLAARNHGNAPLEALRYDVTPAGLHYLLVHYDIPFVDPASWRLTVTGHGHTGVDHRPRRALGDAAHDPAGDLRMRRQRPRQAVSPAGQPTLVDRGGGHCR